MRARAELAQVWPRDGRLRLIGRLCGPRPAGTGEAGETVDPGGAAWDTELVLLVARRAAAGAGAAAGPLRYPVTLDGREWDAWLPVADLVPERLAAPLVWDLWLVPPRAAGERPRLRVGRVLDDIRDKKTIMVFPGQRVCAGPVTAVVRPYYTIKENLSVEVRAMEPEAAG